MGLVRCVILWLLVPIAVLADPRPAELPPGDFTARQYIDSKGCVFLRDGAGWQPRLARDGAAICGYPPSLSLRGLDGKARLAALDPDAGKSRAQRLEEALTPAVVPNLQPGELTSDPRPLTTLPDMGPEPAPTAPLENLKAALRAAPAIRQGMSRDLKPNRRLCELLGHDAQPVPARLGRDPSHGYCGNLSESDLARLAFARPLEAATQGAKPAPVRKVATSVTKPKSVATPRTAISKVAVPAPAAPLKVERLVPPGARYVQVGSYANAGNADRAAQRVMRLGYPVSRGREGKGKVQFIMAGPFDTREGIVRALDGLRRGGFADAYPR
ncbi:SPOR domain-containing protein [Paracoccus laeviglucosivorans]|uniref:Sporulation related domain-containing protein n=1 Tax=Paracoccus laeviglucosivorans TaxID=1197861 RepID=A0A521AEC0_9RHOB|nr:SPOR domain-containing protein [Paracoccus laeviglucosivorans]SMO33139.1 Sporulation related domain-containing protein [Paracoccus laeviglucosivorans]